MRGRKINTLEQTTGFFWSKVNKTETCWLWTGCTLYTGYGQIRVGHNRMTTHRFSWMIHNGSFNNLLVLHDCDIKNCINPDHLFLGTAKDNAVDAMQKRNTIVINKGTKKLKQHTIDEIRVLYNTTKLRQHELASMYKISRATVFAVVNFRDAYSNC